LVIAAASGACGDTVAASVQPTFTTPGSVTVTLGEQRY
jgi:hypothetical protein